MSADGPSVGRTPRHVWALLLVEVLVIATVMLVLCRLWLAGYRVELEVGQQCQSDTRAAWCTDSGDWWWTPWW